MPIQPLFVAVGLLLFGQQCSDPSSWASSANSASKGANGNALARELPAEELPVDRLIQAILDTGATASPAADARLGLQAGTNVRAFYASAPAPVWTLPADTLTPDARAVLALLADAPAYGLRAADYGVARLRALQDSVTNHPVARGGNARRARFDVYLTDAALRLMSDLYRGRLRPYTVSPREQRAKQPFAFADTLRAGLVRAAVPATIRACQPPNREYRLLQAALAHWRNVPPAPDSAAAWQARYEQIAVNLERWRWEAIADSAYVLVNLPAFELLVVRAETVVQQHRVIVGTAETPTPVLSSAITYFTTAPDWRVPRSIATKEILPRLRRDAGYLARNNYSLYDQHGRLVDPAGVNWQKVTAKNFTYSIRQSAGCENALGNIVFRFKNPYSVYIHDTPARQLFERPGRALSHSCIRLEKPPELAAFLLRRDGQRVRLPSEDACANQPQPEDFKLRRSMPLHVRYATCAAENGQIRFYSDVYGQDEGLRRGLFPAAGTP